MKVELKQVVDQLNEALGILEGFSVAACVTEDGDIEGWVVVEKAKDGTITPKTHTFKNLTELFDDYKDNGI